MYSRRSLLLEQVNSESGFLYKLVYSNKKMIIAKIFMKISQGMHSQINIMNKYLLILKFLLLNYEWIGLDI